MSNTEEMDKLEDLKALQSIADALNDLICVISYSGNDTIVQVVSDELGRPQVQVSFMPED